MLRAFVYVANVLHRFLKIVLTGAALARVFYQSLPLVLAFVYTLPAVRAHKKSRYILQQVYERRKSPCSPKAPSVT